MGRENNVTCITCKKHFECGCQRYTLWLSAHSISEWDEEAKKHPDLALTGPNIALKNILTDHDGHELLQWWSDHYSLDDDGKLWVDGAWGSVDLLADCAGYEWS